MFIGDLHKANLYREAITHCQKTFRERINTPETGKVSFINGLDKEHANVSSQLKEGLVKIEKAYLNSMEQMGGNIFKGSGIGTGLGSIVFGVCCFGMELGVCLLVALIGGLFGGAIGFIISGVKTRVDADKKYEESLEELFQKEVTFVSTYSAALEGRINAVVPLSNEHIQLEALRVHFLWICCRKTNIDLEVARIESKNRFLDAIERAAYNRRQAERRNNPADIVNNPICPEIKASRDIYYPFYRLW